MSGKEDKTPSWIAVDWGTSHLRIWPMDAGGQSLSRIDSELGMSKLSSSDYEETLLRLLGSILPSGPASELPVTVVCCGMAGSRQGWREAPYATVPCTPPSVANATRVETTDKRIAVHILPGVKQLVPADVMRGEETQIKGVLVENPAMDGVICLPGTHTKWACVADGKITGFSTYMSGELFQLLSRQSVLRHSLGEDGWDRAAFLEGCATMQRTPYGLANALFGLRAEALLSDLDPVVARARLSGYLLGLEIESTRSRWLGKEVVIVGEDGIAGAYATALREQGVEPRTANVEHLTLAGLRAAWTEIVKG